MTIFSMVRHLMFYSDFICDRPFYVFVSAYHYYTNMYVVDIKIYVSQKATLEQAFNVQ